MLRAHGISDPGTTRKINEDSLFSDENLGLFVVADGMGGHAAGEVASRLAIEAVEGFIRRSQADQDFSWPYGIDASLGYDGNRLRTAISLANRRVFRAAESHDDYTGMGSTVVAALVAGRRLSIGSVGDSRVYLWSDSTLTLLTEDDTWVGMLRAQNASIDPAVLARHPMRHVLTNVLGAREETTAHVSERDLRDGDVLLLCSDGLHGPVPEDVIAARLIAAGDLPEAAQGLVQAALDRGGRDNVTVLLVTLGWRAHERPGREARPTADGGAAGADRPLPDRRSHRQGRDGRRLPRARRAAGPDGRREGPDDRLRGGARRPGPLLPRGAVGGPAAAPQHHHDLRPWRRPRARVHRDGVAGGRDARRLHGPPGGGRPRVEARPHDAGLRRAGRGPRARASSTGTSSRATSSC